MQRWSPDTCRCVFIEDIPSDGSPKTLHSVENKCPAHAALSDADLYDALYAAPHGENRRKNELEGFLLNHPDFGQDIVTPHGDTVRAFKAGIGVSWQWTGDGADRVLVTSITGINLTPQRRQAIQAFIDGGPHKGRVVLP